MKRNEFQTTVAYKAQTNCASSSRNSLAAVGIAAFMFFSPLHSSDLAREIDPPETVEKPEDKPPPQPEVAPAAEPSAETSQSQATLEAPVKVFVDGNSLEFKSRELSTSAPDAGQTQHENPTSVEAAPNPKSSTKTSTLSEDSINSPLVYGTDRPDWLGRRPDVSGEIHQVFVGTDLKSSPEECKKDYERALLQAMREYLAENLLSPSDAEDIPELTGKYIRDHWVDGTRDYLAKVTTGEGNFYQLWSVVELDRDARKQLLSWQAKALQPKRIETVAAGLVGLLTVFGVINLGARFMGRHRNSSK